MFLIRICFACKAEQSVVVVPLVQVSTNIYTYVTTVSFFWGGVWNLAQSSSCLLATSSVFVYILLSGLSNFPCSREFLEILYPTHFSIILHCILPHSATVGLPFEILCVWLQNATLFVCAHLKSSFLL